MRMKWNSSHFSPPLSIVAALSLLIPFSAEAQKVQKRPEVNPLEVPYVSTYYIEPLLTPRDEAVIRFYVSDWNQSEYRLGDDSFRFEVTLEYGLSPKNTRRIVKKNLKAGDHSISLGKLRPGEYTVSLQAVDSFGRASNVLYNEFLVRDAAKTAISPRETYRMTEADLKKYNISNHGDYGKIELVDLKQEAGISASELAASPGISIRDILSEKSQGAKVPPGKYTVFAIAENGVPLNGNWKNCQILYGKGYDRETIEQEAVATLEGINRMLEDCAKKGFRKLVMLPGTYRISHTGPIRIPDRFTLDLNGAVVKLHEFTGCSAVMIQIRDCFDSHVMNGIVEGDYFEHDYENSEKNSEWVCGIDICGSSKYSSFENMEIRYITGYAVMNGFKDSFAQPLSAGAFVSGGIDRRTGQPVSNEKLCSSSGFLDITRFVPHKYLAVSLYLGYQGMGADSWNYTAYFYDKNKKFLEALEAFQYRIVRIPEKAAFMKVSMVSSDPEKLKNLTVNCFRLPWNCTFRNLKIILARCVGMAQSAMRNFLVEGCEITRSGESGAFCAYDAEDGWDMMQDLTFRKNKFYNNFRNDFLTCAGHNFVVEENEGNIYLWDRTKGYVIRNNRFINGVFGSSHRNRSLLCRIENNTFSGNVRLGDDNKTDDWTIVMRNWEASSVTCRSGGVLADADIKDQKFLTINTLNCNLENVEVNLGGSSFLRSKLKNVQGHSNGDVKILNCEVENLSSNCLQAGLIEIRNSKLTDVQFSYAYWTKPGRFLLENCIVKNPDKPFLRTPAYSVDNFQFTRNLFEIGAAPVVDIYDLRPQDTDGLKGSISFQRNLVKSASALIGYDGSKSSKELRFFIDSSNRMPKTFVPIQQPGLPAKWLVNPPEEKKGSSASAESRN